MNARAGWLLLTVLACSAFVSAGLWQRGRGDDKADFLRAFEAALSAEAVPLDEALASPPTLPRPVFGMLMAVEGAPWLLLDNSRRGNEVGIRAIATYASPAGQVLMVDFGWQALPPDRRLPDLPPPPPRLDARGLLVALPGQGIRLGGNPWPDGATQVLLTYLDADEVAGAIQATPYPGLLRLDPALPVGFARDLDALPNTLSPEKHYGYALQWFGFAAAVAVIFLLLSFRKPRP